MAPGLGRMLLLGPALGIALGLIARAWMRWISVEPEFSWSGTIAILIAFTLFATMQAVARESRARWPSSRITTGARIGAGVFSMGLFGAAGSTMLPTVLFGSLALWRTGWRRVVRALLVLAATPAPVLVVGAIVADHGWRPASIGMICLFAAIYAVVLLVTAPTVRARAINSTAPRTRRRRPRSAQPLT